MEIKVDNTITLSLINQSHAQALFSIVDAQRQHLSTYLPWVGNMQTVADFDNYITHCQYLYSQQQEVSFVIVVNNTVVGRIGLHYINQQNQLANIGYWLSAEYLGQGIVTKACKAIIAYGFTTLQLNRIEIKAAVTNIKSNAIPHKLNFELEGILQQAELVNGIYHNLNIYALLKNKWRLE